MWINLHYKLSKLFKFSIFFLINRFFTFFSIIFVQKFAIKLYVNE